MDDTITGKQLSIDLFRDAYQRNENSAKSRESREIYLSPKEKDLAILYATYTSRFTSQIWLTDRIVGTMAKRETKVVVFSEEEYGSRHTNCDDFRKLFNEEYGKEKRPSLRSILTGNLSQDFTLSEEELVFQEAGDSYGQYKVYIHWK